MTIIGIICEYNPLHLGHIRHIDQTRQEFGGNCAVICVMSGNFVQRGDLAVFSKHARAEAAILSGADLVCELPLPYCLSSAEGFSRAGVYLLDRLGADFISFGSESGDVRALCIAAEAIVSPESEAETAKWLLAGLSYAAARQKAAEAVLGSGAELFKTPNNLLGIEYIKEINSLGLSLRPFTVKRTGAEHDSVEGCSASAIRKSLLGGVFPVRFFPENAVAVYEREIDAGRGPVSIGRCETAILSRLRGMPREQFAALPGASEGFYRRLWRAAQTEPTLLQIMEKAKTKRYAMSRIRRMLLCSALGVTAEDSRLLPPYIRVLGMNKTGMAVLKAAAKNAKLPVITKPASAQKLTECSAGLFNKEAAATDLYVLGYQNEQERTGGQEWRISPRIV